MTGPSALARIERGLLIADCPRPHCGSAEALTAWQPWFVCSSRWCRAEAPIQWPPDLAGLWRALAVRGNPEWMNWYPVNHPVALRHGLPHGQTVADLTAETVEHAEEVSGWHTFGAVEGGDRLSLGPRP